MGTLHHVLGIRSVPSMETLCLSISKKKQKELLGLSPQVIVVTFNYAVDKRIKFYYIHSKV